MGSFACERTAPFGWECGPGGVCVNGTVCTCLEGWLKTSELDRWADRGGGLERSSLGCNLLVQLDDVLYSGMTYAAILVIFVLVVYIFQIWIHKDRKVQIRSFIRKVAPVQGQTSESLTAAKKSVSLSKKSQSRMRFRLSFINVCFCTLSWIVSRYRLSNPQKVVFGGDALMTVSFGMMGMAGSLFFFLQMVRSYRFLIKSGSVIDTSTYTKVKSLRWALCVGTPLSVLSNLTTVFSFLAPREWSPFYDYFIMNGSLLVSSSLGFYCSLTVFREASNVLSEILKNCENVPGANSRGKGRIQVSLKRQRFYGIIFIAFFGPEVVVQTISLFFIEFGVIVWMYYIPLRVFVGLVSIGGSVFFALKRNAFIRKERRLLTTSVPS